MYLFHIHLRRLLSTVALSAMLTPAAAQLSLDDCWRLSEANYPLIKRYNLIEQTVDRTLSSLSTAWLPQLAINAQATYQSDVATLPEVLTNLLQTNGYNVRGLERDQYRVAAELTQRIYDGGQTRANRRAARTEGEVQAAQNAVDLYAVRQRVSDLFFGALLTDERLLLNDDLQALLEVNLRRLEAMTAGGVAMAADVQLLQAELIGTRQQHVELEAAAESLRQMLALLCGVERSRTDSLLRPVDVSTPMDRQNLRPELALFDARLLSIDAQDAQLGSSLRPQLTLFAQGYYGYTGYDMFRDMFHHSATLNGMVGLRLTWNIGRLYSYRADSRRLDVARQTIDNARDVFLFNNRLQEVEDDQAIAKYRRLIADDDALIGLRTDVRIAAEARLRAGVIQASDLLQELTRENQARISRSAHEIELLQHIYSLRHTLNQ